MKTVNERIAANFSVEKVDIIVIILGGEELPIHEQLMPAHDKVWQVRSNHVHNLAHLAFPGSNIVSSLSCVISKMSSSNQQLQP